MQWLIFVAIMVALTLLPTGAQGKKSWSYNGCYTRDCVTAYLNSLPSDVQVVISYDADAKLDAYDIWVQR